MVPVPVEDAYDFVLPEPLPTIFNKRFLAIPAIKEVRDQEGEWGSVGQSRTICLADGGSMREELTLVEAPRQFTYLISDVTGPMKALVSAVEGRWMFEPEGTGVRIRWAWTVHPRGALGAVAMPMFGRMWHGYARRALARIEQLLLSR